LGAARSETSYNDADLRYHITIIKSVTILAKKKALLDDITEE